MVNTPLNHVYSIFPLIGSIISALIFISAIAFKFTSKKNLNHIILMAYAIFHWQFFQFLLSIKILPAHSDLIARAIIIGVLFVPLSIYLYWMNLLNLKVKYLSVFLTINFLAIYLILFTNKVIAGYHEYFFGYYPMAGKYFVLIILYSTFLAILGNIRAIRIFISENNPSLKKKYFLISITAFMSSLSMFDFIPNYKILMEKINYNYFPMGGLIIILTTSIFIAIYLYYQSLELEETNIQLNKSKIEEVALANIQKEAALTNMKLLQSQLNPHFIFNSLNSIKSAVLTDSQQARTIITKMSSILRWILSKKEQDLMDLKEEVEAVKSYLDIEQIRMGDYLKLNYLIDASLMDKKVPNFIIQPLVENAVKYGQRTSKENLNIDVQISQKLNYLNISVSNSGKWVDPKTNQHQYSTAVGLSNLKDRMNALYNSNFTLKTLSQNGIVRVELSIPLTS